MINLHAVLVHESRACVLDLVRNLRQLDPASRIVLYNGGQDPNLLTDVDWAAHETVVHPAPRRMKWGWLHDFALDTMRFGLELCPFDTLTIVDSDQLALRPGYSQYLAAYLEARGTGASRLGLLGSSGYQERSKASPPALRAYEEFDLWRPFLRRFAGGEEKFVHWTFWPSTVFTAAAAQELLALWGDSQLQGILKRSKIWATEEVIFPTLLSVLGFEIALNPCRHDFVRYRARYTPSQLDAALSNPTLYWVHPVPRRPEDRLRLHLRRRLLEPQLVPSGNAWSSRVNEALPAERSPTAGLRAVPTPAVTMPAAPISSAKRGASGIVRSLAICKEIRAIEGWLEEEEADLLVATAVRALSGSVRGDVVEVGSYCGKGTVALARVLQALAPDARLCSIDAHDGVVGARDGELKQLGPTRQKLERTLARAELRSGVDVHEAAAPAVAWSRPVALLVIDGLHDEASVRADFAHFEPWIDVGGYVAFHDCAHYFPGVGTVVEQLLASGAWQLAESAGTLVVLQRRQAGGQAFERAPVAPRAELAAAAAESATPSSVPAAVQLIHSGPRVSCIMPTADRRQLVPAAIRYFLEQNYANRELVIIDDGRDPVQDLVPNDARITYQRLAARRSVGEKRNLACGLATGEVILHWDDDDWMSPWRVSYQVRDLLERDASVAGLSNILYYAPLLGSAWEYRYPAGGRPWVAGNSLCYRKSSWQRHPFPLVNVGEDTRFVWADPGARLCVHRDQRFLVATIHPTNTARKNVRHRFWRRISVDTVREILGPAWQAYQQLFPSAGALQAAPRSA